MTYTIIASLLHGLKIRGTLAGKEPMIGERTVRKDACDEVKADKNSP
jgi:hypothetical protein